jgi:hypothetical protein
MDGDHGLAELRFEGRSNEELANQVEGLRGGGAGAETLDGAVRALLMLADGLAETDATLRAQLQEIGVTWTGEAAGGGAQATENASVFAEDANGPVRDSAKGVDSQGASFSNTRNSAPESGTLLGPTAESLGDKVAGLFGHTTDHAADVRATNAARDAAVDGLNGYRDSSSSALQNSQALPVPPGINLNARPVEQQIGTTEVQSASPGGGLAVAGGGPGGGGPVGAAPLAGGGGGALPLGSTNPGPTTGFGPINQPGVPTVPGAGPGGLRVPINPLVAAEAAALMGAGGASGAGLGADGERTTRGGGAGGGARTPAKGASPLASAPAEESRAARNAERYGARTGRPGSSIMQPAAAGQRGQGEDDQDHVRRYGIDSGDVFEDERVVAPESIGDEDRP